MLVNGMTLGFGKGQGATNLAFGSTALASNTSGVRNLAIGD